ncbi:ParB N-terminal domain-containing protein [Amaricoccus sp.]|uniref:ParB/RepB/Spo0J family partition protein n=1 Tax=Amaricoccus sp. TaxID=1872485 RepID=UPI001B60484C|nr:ParB N-terminal domain-containing protein [Amaricoccus sp.]MBP7001336.1 ParB N-terminal domain-containing protein [Amaricoccus sp.]
MPDHAPEIRLIPIAEIDAEALLRDRGTPDPEGLAELRASVLVHGVRQPIEVWEAPEAADLPPGAFRFGLITGWRRLHVATALNAETGGLLCRTIPALIRPAPETSEEGMVAMVEENEIRADLSAWERGRLIVRARDHGIFPTLDAAIEALYRNVGRNKRIRLRQLATVVEELDGLLHAPEGLSQRQALRLAEACQRGYADLIRAALSSLGRAARAAQWDALAPILREMDETPETPAAVARPGRPRRLSEPRPGLVIRRERTRAGYSLHFNGPDATPLLIDAVFDEIDRLFSPA